MKNLGYNSFILLIKFLFINFSLIPYEKGLNIPDDKEEDLDDNILIFIYCVSFSVEMQYIKS